VRTEGGALRARIEELVDSAVRELAAADSVELIEELRVRYLGRKGRIAALFADLAQAPADERPQLGKLLNAAKNRISEEWSAQQARVAQAGGPSEWIDATLPGRRSWRGRPHIITSVLEEMKQIFSDIGFSVVLGPEIELDAYNFEALNFPADHPARDLQDTFYISDDVLLRTQTSPMQVRVMQAQEPPVRVVVPGRVYRNEAIDASHAAEFYQLEGLYVDRHVSMVDLKATVAYFVRRMFGPQTAIRFKPHYFPFTEPSVDVDMKWEKTGEWLEIMGAGMVHPNVFRAAGYDPEQVKGFAFGMGVDRIAMLRHGIRDIRLLLENDIRFLEQF
jgi:phenylalanyl-tRNA synthetase alpha chain